MYCYVEPRCPSVPSANAIKIVEYRDDEQSTRDTQEDTEKHREAGIGGENRWRPGTMPKTWKRIRGLWRDPPFTLMGPLKIARQNRLDPIPCYPMGILSY